MAKKAYVGHDNTATYRCVEYLKSSSVGGQCITTGIYPYKTKIEIGCSFDTEGVTRDTDGYEDVVGAVVTDEDYLYDPLFVSTTTLFGTVTRLYTGSTLSGADSSDNKILPTTMATIIYNTDPNKSSSDVNYNGSKWYAGSSFLKPLDLPSQGESPICFFDDGSGDHCVKGCLIYYVKIWDETNTLLGHFVPALNDSNVPGMYDLVTKTFFINTGTGNFTYGDFTGAHYSTGSASDQVARKITKMYCGVPKNIRQMGYIQSSGAQYINTGINGEIKAEIDMAFQSFAEGNNTILWGENSASPWGCNGIRWMPSSNTFQLGQSTTYSTSAINDIVLTKKYKLEIQTKADDYYLKLNGITKVSGSNGSTLSTSNIYLFANNSGGTAGQFSNIRLYGCKIWKDNVLVRDYIPVVVDTVCCLYDKVEKKFYYNAGTGSFSAGYDKNVPQNVELDYIESTGTQYIDTGIVPKSTTRMILDVQVEDLSIDNRNGWGSTASAESFFVGTHTSISNFHANISSNWTRTETTIPKDTSRHVWDISNSAIKLDNVSYGTGDIGDTAEAGQTLYLFALHVEYSPNIYYCKERIYSCQIYDGNTLVRDFVPMLDNYGTPCLYDNITETYFYNQGTGQFIYQYEDENSNYISTGRYYIPLNYIQSTGTQYIDTKFNVTPDSRIRMSLQHTSYAKQDRFFGSYDSTGLYCCTYINGSNYYAFAYQDDNGNWVSTSKTAKNNTTLNIDYNGKAKTMTLSGAVSYSGSLSSYTATKGCKNNLVIFAGNDNGSIVGKAKMKLYYCEIYNNGALVRNLIPVLDENGVACLYDKVSRNFFYNAGTGTFTAGSVAGDAVPIDYEKVDYIQSSGVQYINTNYIGAAKIEAKVNFVKTVVQNYNTIIASEKSSSPYSGNGIRYCLDDNTWQLGNGGASSWATYSSPLSLDTDYIFEANTNPEDYYLKINNETVISGTGEGALSTNPLYLFANNQDVFAKHFSAMKLYYCKIWNTANELIHDFIPIIDFHGRPCLYDKVEEKFYCNLASTQFICSKAINFQTAYARKIKKAYVGVKNEYKKLEYLESTGAQYINTGITPTQNTKVKLGFEIVDGENAQYSGIFGVQNTDNNTGGSYTLSTRPRVGYLALKCGDTEINNGAYIETDKYYDVETSFQELKVNGTTYTGTSTWTNVTGPMYIFGRRSNQSTGIVTSTYTAAKLYYFQVYENDELVLDLIPILNENNVPCLYDRISGNTKVNQGAGTFTYGYKIDNQQMISTNKSYTPVEYIASSGTQYIDTKIKPNGNIRCIVDFQYTSTSSQSGLIGAWENSKGMLFGVNSSKFQFAFGTSAWAGSTTTADTNRHMVYMNNKDGNGLLDTTTLANKSNVVSLVNDTKNIHLFKSNGGASYGSVKVYACKIYHGNCLVRDFIPVLDNNNIACMFDKVSNSFFYNAGTGSFTAGTAIGTAVTLKYQEIKQVESTGTQYVDTELVPNQNTGFDLNMAVLDIVPTDASSAKHIINAGGTDSSNARFCLATYEGTNGGEFVLNTSNALNPKLLAGCKDISISYKNKIYTDLNGDETEVTVADFTAATNLMIFATANGASYSVGSKIKLYSFKVYNGSTLIRNYVPVLTQENQVCLLDKVENKFYSNKGTNNLLIKHSNDNIIIKNNIARLFFTTSYTTLQKMNPIAFSTARHSLGSASVGDYALFAGGTAAGGTTNYNKVDAYSGSLIRSTPTARSRSCEYPGSASIGNYALFAGGETSGGTIYADVDAYNTSLTKSTPTALSVKRYGMGGASVGNYALFAGGIGNGYQDIVDAYSTSLVRSTPTKLGANKYLPGAASVGDYALFAGGRSASSTYTNSVYAYNTSLVRSTPTSLSSSATCIGGATTNKYAFFAGGYNGNTDSSVVNAYNTSLVRSIPTSLTAVMPVPCGVGIGNIAIFAYTPSEKVNIYNENLTRTTQTAPSYNHSGGEAATIAAKDYIIFGGGNNRASTYVDVYSAT